MDLTYDPILVAVSVLVAVVGAYACFDLVIRVQQKTGVGSKRLLWMAAFSIGGSIWAMHFIAMLAVRLPVIIRYDFLTTLVSGLASILMTAAALAIVSSEKTSASKICIAGVVMGAGISVMHYVGMSGIRGNCGLSYSPGWVVTSVIVGILASTGSIWLAMSLKLMGNKRRFFSAILMGFSIAGVHYTGMLGTTFMSIDLALEFTQPILSPFSIGLITALVSFVIVGGTLMLFMPNSGAKPQDSIPEVSDTSSGTEGITDSSESLRAELSNGSSKPAEMDKIPVQHANKTQFIAKADLASVSANGHYTVLRTKDGTEHFCNHSFSELISELDTKSFIQVHRCHAVCVSHINSFERNHDKGQVSMGEDGHIVPVSRSQITKLQSVLGLTKA